MESFANYPNKDNLRKKAVETAALYAMEDMVKAHTEAFEKF